MGSNENVEKQEAPVKLDRDDSAPGLELTTVLPEGSATNARGVPTYMGLAGTKLISMITVFATTGFCEYYVFTPPFFSDSDFPSVYVVLFGCVVATYIGCSGSEELTSVLSCGGVSTQL